MSLTLHLPTLLYLCIAALVVSAAVMTLFGRTQRVYRGYWWWTLAQWMLAAGMGLHAARDAVPEVLPLANLLLLQWPIVVLSGMRRFYPRHGLRVPAACDGVLLALAYLAWLATWAAQSGLPARVAAFSGGALLLHLYGAVLMSRMTDFRQSAALKALAGVELFGALVQAARLAGALAGPTPGTPGPEVLLGSGLVVVASALVMIYAALLLTYERSVANLRAMHRKLRFLADIDVLTRVPNRRHFHELAARSLEGGPPGHATLMMFDVDHFKRVNDLLGHAVGDEALRQVARCVRDTLRAGDVAGRLGGDEFAVLLPHTDLADAMGVASRIVSRLGDRQVAPRTAPVSLSFGVVQVGADEAVADALRRADQALYEAKRQGRSCAVTASGVEEEPVFGESRRLGLSIR